MDSGFLHGCANCRAAARPWLSAHRGGGHARVHRAGGRAHAPVAGMRTGAGGHDRPGSAHGAGPACLRRECELGRAGTVFDGADDIQRHILAQRVLGQPREART